MLGIVIITYNISSDVLLLQLDAIKTFCTDEHEIIIVDNSFDEEKIIAIKHHTEERWLEYYKTFAGSKNGSESHAFAANFIYEKIKDRFEYLFFLDHDCIPVKTFSVKEILSGGHIAAGLGQAKSKTYFWPGCFMFKNSDIDKQLVDFSPEPGLDTGGGLWRIIDRYGEDQCLFFDESYHQNPHYSALKYNHYAMINKNMFLHFVNASNWAGEKKNEERINALINITREKIENETRDNSSVS